jgi:TonB family protein
MDLRCIVFCSDPHVAETVCQVLAELGALTEHCPDASAAAERVAKESLQIAIVDWDSQAQAELILKTARGRKPVERPLTLAIVSQDSSVPKALQAGANSVLRKPLLTSQVKDTLQTALSLLKARREPAPVAVAQPAPTFSVEPPNDSHLRAGEFLQSAGTAPATQFDTESEMQKSMDRSAIAEIDPLKDLEPTAAAVVQQSSTVSEPAPDPLPNEPRGLQWYLKQRGISADRSSFAAAAAPAPNPSQPELIGYDQSPSVSPPATAALPKSAAGEVPVPLEKRPEEQKSSEQKQEAQLFAYMDGQAGPAGHSTGRSFHLGRKGILFAATLAAIAIAAAPQAPWHGQSRTLWNRGQKALHAWLNPQPVAPPQATPTHEDFGRAGDEYKLPVAETIPDATTDPSQIRVVPMIDPTAKKPNPGTSPDPNAPAPDGTAPTPTDTNPSQPSPGTPGSDGSTSPGAAPGSVSPQASPDVPPPASTGQIKVSPAPLPAVTAVPALASAHSAPGPSSATHSQGRPSPAPAVSIPSSLKSQMASMTPEASGNKAPETALPSIEPVSVPESAERGLLTAQPPISYPTSAKGQQGTVVLQVLIGRDGTVQDAKFLQGSLAFARNAIDGVRQWTFKPYLMNGRPVSVQTQLTLIFKPGA